MHKSDAGLLDPKWKFRWHIVVLILAIAVIVLTGIYMNISAFFTRPDIMAIPFVGALRWTHYDAMHQG